MTAAAEEAARRAAIRAAQNAHAAEVEAWAEAERRKGERIKAAMAALDVERTP